MHNAAPAFGVYRTVSLCLKKVGLSSPIIKQLFTLLLITALVISPLLFFRDQRVIAAERQAPPSAPPPISAPPEPFVLPWDGVTETVFPAVTEFFASIAGLLSRPNEPKAANSFDASRRPQLFRLDDNTSSVAGASAAPLEPLPTQPNGTVDFDFDGDGKSDIGRWHSANTEFKIRTSTNGSYPTYAVGSSPDSVPAPAKYDSDGITDAATFENGTWKIRKSSDGTTTTITGFGQAGDIPQSGDYTGNSSAELAFYRPSNGTWYWREFGNSTVYSQQYGLSTDIPVAGNYDGVNGIEPAVFRPSTGTWWISSIGAKTWGLSTDVPVPADYDGDGKTDPAVFRPSTGVWYVLLSGTNYTSYSTFTWGNYADQPVVGDFDGDGKADYAVWRPSTGVWWIYKSATSTYDAFTLGVNGDYAVPSAYIKQVNGNVPADDLAAARLSPRNATGSTNFYSQNFNWSSNLLSLPGRSGMDLNIPISYNSLIWTKVGSTMVFDPDYSTITPGFRFGFPTIEPNVYDDNNGKNSYVYVMVTPSGRRVEFRQSAVSGTYETADSTYAQLVTSATDWNADSTSMTITVTTTDGTQMSYAWMSGEFRCTEIKDRNGNRISITNDSNGKLTSITDTLGRVISVTYNSSGLPDTIAQTWKDNNGQGSEITPPHRWASFTYTTKTLNYDFASTLAVAGPPNSQSINVLQKIDYPDGSATTFDYNDYLQVYKVSNIAADSSTHVLNYTRTNLQTPSVHQPDCPRFTDTYNWAEKFNPDSYGVAQETHITNSELAGTTYTLPGSITGSAWMVNVALENHPNALHTHVYYGSSGWSEGLEIATEDCVTTACSGSDRVRWTWNNYTQDDTSKSYIVNPRLIENRIGDGTNTKKTTYEYLDVTSSHPASTFGLVTAVSVGDLSSVMKRYETDYVTSSTYTGTGRRIIGLPLEARLLDGNNTLMSKTTFGYDEGDFSDSTLYQDISPTQHDEQHYSSSFVIGRGNQTSVKRYTLDHPGDSSYAITSSVKYNTAGSPVSTTTPWDGTNTRTIRIGYNDVWNDSVSRSTYAYPTTLTDPAGSSLGASGHSSTIIYRFDIGTNVEATSPPPAGNTYGKKTKRIYDEFGRLQRNSIYTHPYETWQEYSYVRHAYPTNGVQTQTYSTVTDANDNGVPDSADEVLTESWTDGAGNVLQSRTPHTFNTDGSTATWSGTVAKYDILGRVIQQSVPTEVDSSWSPAGDDASRGFLWTYQKYDWKDRVVRKINTDGIDQTTLNDTDIIITYGGCGCSGGQITTIESERVPIPGTSNFARRKQKIYDDPLGRSYMTETYDWDGTVYATTVQTFNARDQVTKTTQYTGSTVGSTYQDTIMTYDGFGRLATSHKPEQQNSDTTAAHTTYAYNPDDSIASITDARGASTSYTYNNLRLPTVVHYNAPSGISIPNDIDFSYDGLGNRTSMTDALGTVSYVYDSLSRMTSETRVFSDALSGSPNSDSTYQIHYTYGLNGQLATLQEPFGTTFAYGYDKVGRPTSVKPTSAYGGLTANQNLISGIQYRAFGSIKQADYANGTQMTETYNSRLQPSAYRVKANSNNQILFGEDYYFTTGSNNDNDGRLKHSVFHDDRLSAEIQAQADRTDSYDAVGRINHSWAGETAYTPSSWGLTNGPFREDVTYDAYDHVTNIHDWDFEYYVTGCYGCPRSTSYSESFSNNRTTGSSWYANPNSGSTSPFVFDEDGRLKTRGTETYQYDASGQRTSADMTGDTPDPAYVYDGDQKLVRYSENGSVKDYHLISSVLGSTVTDLTASGAVDTGYIVASNGSQLATVHSNAVSITYSEPLSQDQRGMALDKTSLGGSTYDPFGRSTGYAYRGGGPCGTSCPAPYNPPGGFDGLAILMSRSAQHQWENDLFWNVENYVTAGAVVSNQNPPPGWTWAGTYEHGINGSINRFGEPPDFAPNNVGFGDGWQPPFVFDAFGFIEQEQIVPLGDIKEGVKALLMNPTCGSFTEKVIRQVAKDTGNPFTSDYVPSLFPDVDVDFSDQGYITRPNGSKEHVAGRLYPRDPVTGREKLGISPHDGTGYTEAGIAALKYDYIETYLHELIHAAGSKDRYSDSQIATAIVNLIKSGDLSLPKSALDQFDSISSGDEAAYSRWYDVALQHFCPGIGGVKTRGDFPK